MGKLKKQFREKIEQQKDRDKEKNIFVNKFLIGEYVKKINVNGMIIDVNKTLKFYDIEDIKNQCVNLSKEKISAGQTIDLSHISDSVFKIRYNGVIDNVKSYQVM